MVAMSCSLCCHVRCVVAYDDAMDGYQNFFRVLGV